ncbi:MAG: KpsF/GutQ family sugar-phosphate isomerase [Bacteroidota bacterium]|nr:KpsF/GutQ family sugar-phosphate isomerase [Bacteroidota bacterium]MDP4229374.1 KpsF/GutQ family sugar-phosphate isomerase [Bacteroidota bacterium]MDP4235194.1 KpsF/GutQ family sugar-phosphate isomerase [Bacteroidota bacterium]
MIELNETSKAYFESAKRTFAVEANAIMQTSDALDELDFAKACELLLKCNGRIIVSGMGKSGHVARKIASTLTSTGTPAIFLHPAEAAHGDIGLISPGDALLILSKSGESDELVSILNAVAQKHIPVVAITSNPLSRLAISAKKSGGVVLFPIVKEEACPHDLAPTSSTTAQLVLGDALAIALLEARKFTSEDFAKLHPGGALGKKLTMHVRDLMAADGDTPRIGIDSSLPSVMHEISVKRFGAACVIGEEGELLGIITDGDLRRYFQSHEQIDIRKVSAGELMAKDPKTTTSDTLAIDALHLMEDTLPKVMQLPVIDSRKNVIGMIHLHDIVKAGISG